MNLNNKVVEEEAVWACGICDQIMKKRTPAIACLNCRNWIHLGCSGLTANIAKKMAKTFICSICQRSINNVFARNEESSDGDTEEDVLLSSIAASSTGSSINITTHSNCGNDASAEHGSGAKNFIENSSTDVNDDKPLRSVNNVLARNEESSDGDTEEDIPLSSIAASTTGSSINIITHSNCGNHDSGEQEKVDQNPNSDVDENIPLSSIAAVYGSFDDTQGVETASTHNNMTTLEEELPQIDEGATYHLFAKNSKIFFAELVSVSSETLVHGKQLQEGYGKFKLRSIYIRRALNWNQFDPDIHCIGTFIAWKLTETKKRILPRATSEALDKEGPKEVEKGKGRKRVRQQELWQSSQRKKKRMLGESYSPQKRKNGEKPPKKPARVIKEPCPGSCRFACYERLTLEERERVFEQFWGFNNSQKAQFIVNNITVTDKKRERKRKTQSGITRKREKSRVYRLLDSNVCKTMFHNTLNVSETYVKTCLSKADEGGIANTTHGLEGKKGNNSLSEEQISSIKEHIQSFPVMESHYLREQTTRQYLSSDLNVNKMYDLYKEKNIGNENIPSLKSYRNIFNEKFNLGFHKPKKDQCSVCLRYKNSQPDEQKRLQAVYDEHLLNKTLAQEAKANFKEFSSNKENQLVYCFDLQKVLQTPFGENSEFFYVSKLSVYNFTIYDILNKQGFCFFWDETVAGRGANEVGSCIYSFLDQKCTTSKNEVTLFADNCPGQNRNRFIIKMLSILVKNNEYIKGVQLVFLEKGHTQNENDSVHSRIEREKKGKTVYHPGEWVTLAERACKVRPYVVSYLNQSTFLNFKDDVNGLYSGLNSNKLTQVGKMSKNVSWSKIKMVRFEKDDPYLMLYKYNLCEPFRCIHIANPPKQTRRSIEAPKLIVQKAYNSIRPITTKKHAGLQRLCKVGAIPQPFHAFYSSLSHKASVAGEENFSDSEEDE